MGDRVEDEASTKDRHFALNASHQDQNKVTFFLTSVSKALFVGVAIWSLSNYFSKFSTGEEPSNKAYEPQTRLLVPELGQNKRQVEMI